MCRTDFLELFHLMTAQYTFLKNLNSILNIPSENSKEFIKPCTNGFFADIFVILPITILLTCYFQHVFTLIISDGMSQKTDYWQISLIVS